MLKRTKTLLGLLLVVVLLAAALPMVAQNTGADLDGVKDYLLERTAQLEASAEALRAAVSRYYTLAEAAGFDYGALAEQPEALAAIDDAKAAWIAASPVYEQMEGIVAGVPTLADYDVTLDAGASGEDDPENGVSFDLTLADGRVLERPGNLFGLLEATLWATRPEFSSGVEADIDGSGVVDFGEVLPEANVLLAAADMLHSTSAELAQSAADWQPSETDAFTALVVMVPTMSEYFGSWKESRFVAGEESTQTDFVVISRLADIQDILGGLQVVYDGVSPRVLAVNAERDAQIRAGLDDLQAYVADLYAQEQAGRRFSPEEADIFGSEAQDQAMAITGQISQVAALLNIELAE